MTTARRLDALSRVWPPEPAEAPEWLRRMERQAELSAEYMAFYRHARVRGIRRHLHERGALPPRLDDDPDGDHARTLRELDDLAALQAAHGVVGGWRVWLLEAESWPQLPGWDQTEAGFLAEVEDWRRLQREHRTATPLAAWRERTGWHEGLSRDEERAMEARWVEARR